MIELLNNNKEFVIRGLLESVFLLTAFYYIFIKTNIKQYLKNKKNFLFVYIFFIMLFFVQIIDRFQYNYPQNLDFYPFMRFAMYQAAPEPVELISYKFIVENLEGEVREINLTNIYSSIGLPSLSSRFEYLIKNFPTTKNEILVWTNSLKYFVLENDIKITVQQIEIIGKKVQYKNLVEVLIEN